MVTGLLSRIRSHGLGAHTLVGRHRDDSAAVFQTPFGFFFLFSDRIIYQLSATRFAVVRVGPSIKILILYVVKFATVKSKRHRTIV